MTISHSHRPVEPGKPFIFASLMTVSCSVCAPCSMSQADVEQFAESVEPGVEWHAIDKSKPPLSIGEPTPHPCNIDPAGRQHWFLMSAELAR